VFWVDLLLNWVDLLLNWGHGLTVLRVIAVGVYAAVVSRAAKIFAVFVENVGCERGGGTEEEAIGGSLA
jgi:hypothetical protein